MNGEMAIIVFFRLGNFALLLVIMQYLWRKYGRSVVYEEFEKAQKYLSDLIASYRQLQKEEELLKKAYESDEKDRTDLKERLHAWKNAVHSEQAAAQRVADERIAALQNIREQQVERVKEYRVYTHLKGYAIMQARQQLEKEFEKKAAQQQVLESVLKRSAREGA